MDEKPKKASLKGRGRDIMRGIDAEKSAAPEGGSSWLPEASTNPDDQPYFEDEEALLRWMEADPEADRPTFVPEKSLVASDRPQEEPALYSDPDFDAIFGETVPPKPVAPPPPQEEEPDTDIIEPEIVGVGMVERNLDGLFSAPDPDFDDLFGDMMETDNVPMSGTGRMTDSPTMELPALVDDRLPDTDDLFARMGELSAENAAAEIPVARMPSGVEAHFEDAPMPEEADYSLIEDDFGTEPAPRPDRRSQELFPPAEEDMVAMGDATAILATHFEEEEALPAHVDQRTLDLLDEMGDTEPSDYFEQAPAASPASWRAEVPASESMADQGEYYEEEPSPYETPSADWQAEVPASEGMADQGEYYEEEPFPYEAPPADWRAEAPASEGMADQGEYYEEEPSPYETPAASWRAEMPASEGMGDATAILGTRFDEEDSFAPHLDQHTFDLLDEMSGEMEETGGYPAQAFQGIRPPSMPAGEAEAFISMLEQEAADQSDETIPVAPPAPPSAGERAAAAQAMLEPLKVMPIDARDQEQADKPFVLTPGDTQPPSSTEPYFGVAPAVQYYEEALPLGEDETETVDLRTKTVPSGAFSPNEAEVLSGGQLPSDLYDIEPAYSDQQFDHMMDVAAGDIGGAEGEATRGLALSGETKLPEPFGAQRERLPAKQLFQEDSVTPDKELLAMLVDDNRIRELFEQIEALQEEIVQNARGSRGDADTYQDELLLASNLLLQSRESYDEARAIVYRVRTDLNRERRVAEDISHYRPLLLNAYVGMAILIVTFALLGQVFISVAESAGVPWIGQGFYPALAGMVGALFFSYLTLHRHTTVERDFDSSQIYWYLFNPLTGILSGFLVYLFLYGTAVTTLSGTNPEITGSSPFTLLVAVAAGFYQNSVINILGAAYQRFAPAEEVSSRDVSPRG